MGTKCRTGWLGSSKECLSPRIGYEAHGRTAKLIRSDLSKRRHWRRRYGCVRVSPCQTHFQIIGRGDLPSWFNKNWAAWRGAHAGRLERKHMEAPASSYLPAEAVHETLVRPQHLIIPPIAELCTGRHNMPLYASGYPQIWVWKQPHAINTWQWVKLLCNLIGCDVIILIVA